MAWFNVNKQCPSCRVKVVSFTALYNVGDPDRETPDDVTARTELINRRKKRTTTAEAGSTENTANAPVRRRFDLAAMENLGQIRRSQRTLETCIYFLLRDKRVNWPFVPRSLWFQVFNYAPAVDLPGREVRLGLEIFKWLVHERKMTVEDTKWMIMNVDRPDYIIGACFSFLGIDALTDEEWSTILSHRRLYQNNVPFEFWSRVGVMSSVCKVKPQWFKLCTPEIRKQVAISMLTADRGKWKYMPHEMRRDPEILTATRRLPCGCGCRGTH